MSETANLNFIDPSGALQRCADRIAGIVAKTPRMPRSTAMAVQAIVETTLYELARDPQAALWLAAKTNEQLKRTLRVLDKVEQKLTQTIDEAQAPEVA